MPHSVTRRDLMPTAGTGVPRATANINTRKTCRIVTQGVRRISRCLQYTSHRSIPVISKLHVLWIPPVPHVQHRLPGGPVGAELHAQEAALRMYHVLREPRRIVPGHQVSPRNQVSHVPRGTRPPVTTGAPHGEAYSHQHRGLEHDNMDVMNHIRHEPVASIRIHNERQHGCIQRAPDVIARCTQTFRKRYIHTHRMS
jgi:hypothetical protein